MALFVEPGSDVPIPCRACGRRLLRFVVKVGKHLLRCPYCRESTWVQVSKEAGRWRIRTSIR